jgi:hypothetical protein
MLSRPAYLLLEPKPCRRPIPLHRCGGDSENLGSFLNGQAPEKTQLDDLSLPGIEAGKFLEGIVKRHQADLTKGARRGSFVQCEPKTPVAFGGTMFPGMINQNLSHQLCRDREEMSPVLEADLFALRKA